MSYEVLADNPTPRAWPTDKYCCGENIAGCYLQRLILSFTSDVGIAH